VSAADAYPGFRPSNALRGALIYGGGDTVAALILGEAGWVRLAGMVLVGATLYALEVPNWFHWIDRRVPIGGRAATLQRTTLALLYFNPLWIARHLLFIALLSGREVGWGLLGAGFYSFIGNIPLSLLANYLIQNRTPPGWRFTASALFSACMAIYYAVSGRYLLWG